MYRCMLDDIDNLLDGRSIWYLSKKLPMNRGKLSLILRGICLCDYETADRIIKRCNPNNVVDDYFVRIESED